MTVELFIPCFINRFFPETGLNMVKVLEKLNCQVNYNVEQSCCGAISYQSGYAQDTCKLAQKLIQDFADCEGFIVSPSSFCVDIIRNRYDLLLDESDRKECYKIQQKTFEFSEFLVDILALESFEGAHLEGVGTYLDACVAMRSCGIYEAPRKLLSQVSGLTISELGTPEFCCGFGGGLPNRFSGLATALAEQKVDQATATQADYIISSDLTCLMHLDGYLQKNRKKIKIMHIADVLASGW